MAWLNTAPTGDSTEKSQSRLEIRKAALKFKLLSQDEFDAFIKMPEIDFEFRHLIEWIHELGFFLNGGMSAIPLSYSEIMAWAVMTENDPTPFDVRCLRDMSNAFLTMQDTAKNPDEPCP